jgi:hypothetical protein
MLITLTAASTGLDIAVHAHHIARAVQGSGGHTEITVYTSDSISSDTIAFRVTNTPADIAKKVNNALGKS